MPRKNIKSIIDLKAGESGRVVQIDGGHGIINRLGALNIRPGTTVTKLNSSFMRGPVTIEVDRTKVAIGFGMAKKILVGVPDITR